MSVRRIVANIRSSHFNENRSFYGDFLGLQVSMDMGWIRTFASPSNPTAQISVIGRDQSAPVHPNLSMEVNDVDSFYDAAVERGLQIVYSLTDEPWEGRRFFVVDPNGQMVNILSHSRND